MSATSTGSTTGDPSSENVNMDATIYNQRMLYVLDRTIARVKIVSVLSSIIKGENGDIVDKMPADLKTITCHLKERYVEENEVVKKKDEDDAIEIEEPFETWTIARSRSEDDDLIRILQYLEDNGSTQSELESAHVDLFTNCLNELRLGVELNQSDDPSKEKVREKHMKRCQIRNAHAKKEIATLEEQLVAKKSDLHASIIGKNLLINRQQGKIDKIQKVSREAIEQRITDSEAIMTADTNANKTILEALGAELKAGRGRYESVLKEHLTIEKDLRLQRTKVENQLVACMQKFDQDMSEKQAEEEELQAEFEEEKRKYEEIQRKLDEQEEEYDELMQEKAAYEQELLEQKLFIFILNRSARRIQRAFRSYKVRKLAKKKTKKGKKGKGKKK